jgi:hypothetical protein
MKRATSLAGVVPFLALSQSQNRAGNSWASKRKLDRNAISTRQVAWLMLVMALSISAAMHRIAFNHQVSSHFLMMLS